MSWMLSQLPKNAQRSLLFILVVFCLTIAIGLALVIFSNFR